MQPVKISVLCLLFSVLAMPTHGERPIDIAAIYALTGVAAEANAFALRGVGYAVAEINARNGIMGREVNLIVLDNQSTPIGSTLAARQAVESDVAAIVGPDWSSHAIAVARVAQAAGVPMISSLSTNPEVTRIGDFIFRVCFTDDYQGMAIARFARKELEALTAVVLTDVTSDYSLELTEIFSRNFIQLGGHVILELAYKQNQLSRIDTMVQQAAQADADVVFIPGHDESGLIARQMQATGVRSRFIGGDGWGNAVFFRKGGGRLKKGYYTTHWSVEMADDTSRAFIQKYLQLETSVENIALGYDAMMLLAAGISRANSADRRQIRDAVATMRGFRGITGAIDFNANGDPLKPIVLMEITDGRPRFLKTLPP